ncbi:hypothetical protein [Clostridium botulinum]|uniref:hypothetical protein n=1 Tax=Clostridium botulinum TaxID=1491 RepID=UPI0004D44FCE|nr:hypothetical protein [Clostridium botulinum]KEI00099.1 hypothetical protein Z952_14030 [Clostridium botulinum C/D str. BKT75002]KEI05950.1 hypothetical protein Z954_14505 [Clostridium botulinum C/D str. BKT2873]QPW62177.1 hypothetical protein IG390_14810 [Clostridium botulinum]
MSNSLKKSVKGNIKKVITGPIFISIIIFGIAFIKNYRTNEYIIIKTMSQAQEIAIRGEYEDYTMSKNMLKDLFKDYLLGDISKNTYEPQNKLNSILYKNEYMKAKELYLKYDKLQQKCTNSNKGKK